MVGLGRVGCDHNEDPADCEKIVDDCPPRVGGEAISGLDLGDDGCDEGDDPRKLGSCQQDGPSKIDRWGRRMGCRMLMRGKAMQGWAGSGEGADGEPLRAYR